MKGGFGVELREGLVIVVAVSETKEDLEIASAPSGTKTGYPIGLSKLSKRCS